MKYLYIPIICGISLFRVVNTYENVRKKLCSKTSPRRTSTLTERPFAYWSRFSPWKPEIEATMARSYAAQRKSSRAQFCYKHCMYATYTQLPLRIFSSLRISSSRNYTCFGKKSNGRKSGYRHIRVRYSD